MEPQYITLTPVNTKESRFYEETYNTEKLNFNSDTIYHPCWKDSMHNKTRVNDYFGFVEDRNIIHICQVVAILPSKSCNPDWTIDIPSENYDGYLRNVLVLSKKLFEDTWVSYTQRTNTFKKGGLRGTRRYKWIPKGCGKV